MKHAEREKLVSVIKRAMYPKFQSHHKKYILIWINLVKTSSKPERNQVFKCKVWFKFQQEPLAAGVMHSGMNAI